MNVDQWMLWVVMIISITAVIKICILISNRNRRVTPNVNRRNRRSISVNETNRSSIETGPMVYYANDHHGSFDKEYRFNYKKVGKSWRAYILRTPSFGNRDVSGLVTHRHWDDNNKPYVCWDCDVLSLKDMQNISRVWADSIQEYIATGKRFG